MSDEFDPTQDELDGGDEGEDQGDIGDAGYEGEAESDPDGQDAETTDEKDKRIRDLMSKWQKAEARLEKLEKQRQETQTEGGGSSPSEVQQYLQLMQEQARDQVYASDPRFGKYQLDSALIEGNTPEQMRQAAKRLSSILDRVETDAKNDALKKHGLSPEVKGGKSAAAPDFSKMSDEEFDRMVERVKGG